VKIILTSILGHSTFVAAITKITTIWAFRSNFHYYSDEFICCFVHHHYSNYLKVFESNSGPMMKTFWRYPR